jgi:hypothetical protein
MKNTSFTTLLEQIQNHTVGTDPKSHKFDHTVGTDPKSHEFYHTVGTDPTSHKFYHTVGTDPKSNRKIVERGKIYTLKSNLYICAMF